MGSGWGETCVEVVKLGAVVTGIEPDQELIQISELLAEKENVCVSFMHRYGEDLPFPSDSFDVVMCHAVLEHVNDIKKTIAEMMRVVKKDGLIHLLAPNYLRCHEGHYEIFYPPLPKWLGKMYIKLRGRNINFIGHINYTTPHSIFQILNNYNVKITDISLSKYIKSVEKNGLIKGMIKETFAKLKLYPTVELLIRKR